MTRRGRVPVAACILRNADRETSHPDHRCVLCLLTSPAARRSRPRRKKNTGCARARISCMSEEQTHSPASPSEACAVHSKSADERGSRVRRARTAGTGIPVRHLLSSERTASVVRNKHEEGMCSRRMEHIPLHVRIMQAVIRGGCASARRKNPMETHVICGFCSRARLV